MLALAPPQSIVGLSKRADDFDSYLRDRVGGAPLRRATTEAVLGARPDIVVRYWGGDQRLTPTLARRGVRVVQIEEASDFAGVSANVRKVALALDRRAAGEALIADMDRKLAASHGAWKGAGAVYLTPDGFTAGRGTLIGAMLTAAGLRNLAPSDDYAGLSMERLVTHPPSALVLGFFDGLTHGGFHWSIGANSHIQALAKGRAIVSLPGSMLGCPAWFAADGALAIARAKR